MIAAPPSAVPEHRMRYAPAERLLRLARHLAATRVGLTLDEIVTELEIGRRTAERPSPLPLIAPCVLPTLRRAILGMQLMVLRNSAADSNAPATRFVCPYGIRYVGRG